MAEPMIRINDDSDENGNAVRIIGFKIPGGVTTPTEFKSAVEKILSQAAGEFGVILDGRGPVWGFGMLIHAAHATKWLATRDPRIGAIVIASHTEGIEVAQVMPFREEWDLFPEDSQGKK